MISLGIAEYYERGTRSAALDRKSQLWLLLKDIFFGEFRSKRILYLLIKSFNMDIEVLGFRHCYCIGNETNFLNLSRVYLFSLNKPMYFQAPWSRLLVIILYVYRVRRNDR